MKKHLTVLFCLAAMLLATACNNGSGKPSKAAQTYMNYLIDKKFDKYVKARADYDSLPESYRTQLIDLTKQYVADEEKARGGLKAASAISENIEGDAANVLLSVTYGNDSIEEILMPLVLVDGEWRLP